MAFIGSEQSVLCCWVESPEVVWECAYGKAASKEKKSERASRLRITHAVTAEIGYRLRIYSSNQ